MKLLLFALSVAHASPNAEMPLSKAVQEIKTVKAGSEPLVLRGLKTVAKTWPTTIRAYGRYGELNVFSCHVAVGNGSLSVPDAAPLLVGSKGEALKKVKWTEEVDVPKLPPMFFGANLILNPQATLELKTDSVYEYRHEARPCLKYDSYWDAEGNEQKYCVEWGAPIAYTWNTSWKWNVVGKPESLYGVSCSLNTTDDKRGPITWGEFQSLIGKSLEFHSSNNAHFVGGFRACAVYRCQK